MAIARVIHHDTDCTRRKAALTETSLLGRLGSTAMAAALQRPVEPVHLAQVPRWCVLQLHAKAHDGANGAAGASHRSCPPPRSRPCGPRPPGQGHRHRDHWAGNFVPSRGLRGLALVSTAQMGVAALGGLKIEWLDCIGRHRKTDQAKRSDPVCRLSACFSAEILK